MTIMESNNDTGLTVQQLPWNAPLLPSCVSRSPRPRRYPAQLGKHEHFVHNRPMKLQVHPDVEAGKVSLIGIKNTCEMYSHDLHTLYPQARTPSFITAASP